MPRLRPPSTRAVVVGAACVVVAALAYALARETPLFAAREIAIVGGSASARAEAREELARLEGESLVALDGDDLARRLAALPAIETAAVDRAFPHTLAVSITEERPLAVLRGGGRAVLVSGTGRVIRLIEPHTVRALPRVPVGDVAASLEAGDVVSGADAVRALAVLDAVPGRFPLDVRGARAAEGGVVLGLEGALDVHVGTTHDLVAKLRAAEAVLRSLSPDERRALAYVDVTLPHRVVASTNPQVESEG